MAIDIRADEVSSVLKQKLADFEQRADIYEMGTVLSVGDGIARVHGLDKVMAGELIEFPHGIMGLAQNLDEDEVGAVLLGDYKAIKEGDVVKRTARIISVPVGDAMLGRVVNARGQPLDGKGPIATTEFLPIERIAAGVLDNAAAVAG